MNVRCNYCNKKGHKEHECHKKERDEADEKDGPPRKNGDGTRNCFRCGKPGHFARECTEQGKGGKGNKGGKTPTAQPKGKKGVQFIDRKSISFLSVPRMPTTKRVLLVKPDKASNEPTGTAHADGTQRRVYLSNVNEREWRNIKKQRTVILRDKSSTSGKGESATDP